MKILFVCTGNTCRSPMAELIAKQNLKEKGLDKAVKVSSAGLNVKENDKINEKAKTALKGLNIKCTSKKARQINLSKLDSFKLIITMTNGQKQFINLKNCFSIADFCGKEVLDPFGKDQTSYNECAKQLKESIDIIFERIFGGKK